MFDRFMAWLIRTLWRPVVWDVHTDDRQVQRSELHQKILAVGTYRWNQQRRARIECRDVPAWVQAGGLHWSRDLEGEGLHTVSTAFIARVRDSRVAKELAEIEARIERVANTWLAELSAEAGLA